MSAKQDEHSTRHFLRSVQAREARREREARDLALVQDLEPERDVARFVKRRT